MVFSLSHSSRRDVAVMLVTLSGVYRQGSSSEMLSIVKIATSINFFINWQQVQVVSSTFFVLCFRERLR